MVCFNLINYCKSSFLYKLCQQLVKWDIFIISNRAHPKLSKGAGNLIFSALVALVVRSETSKFEDQSMFGLSKSQTFTCCQTWRFFFLPQGLLMLKKSYHQHLYKILSGLYLELWIPPINQLHTYVYAVWQSWSLAIGTRHGNCVQLLSWQPHTKVTNHRIDRHACFCWSRLRQHTLNSLM